MNKFVQSLGLVSILFSSAVSANQNNSFYVSADAGIFHADFNNTFLDQTDLIPQNIAQPAEQHGYTGGLAVGYSRLFCQHYFMGAELSGNIDGHYATFQSGASTTAFSDQVQIKSHIDLTFVPGMMLNDTIATYLKLGLSFASLQDSLTSPAGYTPTITNVNSNKNVYGFAAGFGIGKRITEHVALFIEANYHDYGSVSFPNFQNFSATYSHTSHIYSSEVVVGASYKFNV